MGTEAWVEVVVMSGVGASPTSLWKVEGSNAPQTDCVAISRISFITYRVVSWGSNSVSTVGSFAKTRSQ